MRPNVACTLIGIGNRNWLEILIFSIRRNVDIFQAFYVLARPIWTPIFKNFCKRRSFISSGYKQAEQEEDEDKQLIKFTFSSFSRFFFTFWEFSFPFLCSSRNSWFFSRTVQQSLSYNVKRSNHFQIKTVQISCCYHKNFLYARMCTQTPYNKHYECMWKL